MNNQPIATQDFRRFMESLPSRCASLLVERGIIVLDNVPLDLPADRILGAVSHISRVTSFLDQPRVMEVKPKEGFSPQSSGGLARFPPHTDMAWIANPPDVLAMLCVETASKGGEPTFSSLDEALSKLSPEDIQALSREQVFFPAPEHTGETGHQSCILTSRVRGWSLRFNPRAIADTLSPSGERLPVALESVEQNLEVTSGTLWLLDNRQMCHGRREILDGANTPRLFLRVYGKFQE